MDPLVPITYGSSIGGLVYDIVVARLLKNLLMWLHPLVFAMVSAVCV